MVLYFCMTAWIHQLSSDNEATNAEADENNTDCIVTFIEHEIRTCINTSKITEHKLYEVKINRYLDEELTKFKK